jgi:hypothetical protein
VTRAEKWIALAYCRHKVVSLVPRYFACQCGCGYVGVCRHCVPQAPARLPQTLCEEAKALVQAGRARCEEGNVYAVAD